MNGTGIWRTKLNEDRSKIAEAVWSSKKRKMLFTKTGIHQKGKSGTKGSVAWQNFGTQRFPVSVRINVDRFPSSGVKRGNPARKGKE